MTIPAADAAAAESVDEALVPVRRRITPARRSLLERIVQDADLVDRAVDRARLHANDVGNRLAERRGGEDEIGRVKAGACRPARERVAGIRGRLVKVVDAPVDRTVGIERRAEVTCAPRKIELLGRAGERLLLGA